MNSTFLKIAVSALGLAAVTLTPAVAKSARAVRTHAPAVTSMDPSTPSAFASGGALVNSGRILGTDPDPNVRLELQRDYPTYLGDN